MSSPLPDTMRSRSLSMPSLPRISTCVDAPGPPLDKRQHTVNNRRQAARSMQQALAGMRNTSRWSDEPESQLTQSASLPIWLLFNALTKHAVTKPGAQG
jgi:hypothetical protein